MAVLPCATLDPPSRCRAARCLLHTKVPFLSFVPLRGGALTKCRGALPLPPTTLCLESRNGEEEPPPPDPYPPSLPAFEVIWKPECVEPKTVSSGASGAKTGSTTTSFFVAGVARCLSASCFCVVVYREDRLVGRLRRAASAAAQKAETTLRGPQPQQRPWQLVPAAQSHHRQSAGAAGLFAPLAAQHGPRQPGPPRPAVGPPLRFDAGGAQMVWNGF